ncbi:MAG TPA: hypothetical protein VGP31_05770 [Planosporangium sp.]|nr:hypothetical protein [Planosporangium sp.]
MDDWYGIGLMLLANVALAMALHLRMRRELIDEALAGLPRDARAARRPGDPPRTGDRVRPRPG